VNNLLKILEKWLHDNMTVIAKYINKIQINQNCNLLKTP